MQTLNRQDESFLDMETPTAPSHVGGLEIYRLPRGAGRDYMQKLFKYLKAQPVRAEARQYALEWHRTHRTRGCAVIFGANVLVRAGVALVNAATRLLVRRDVVTEAFVASEAEAWALVVVEREKLLAAAAPSS